MRGSRVRYALITVAICLLAALPITALAQAPNTALTWQPLGGPAGRITHLAASPDGTDLYAVSVATTYRKDDQTQWQAAGRSARSDALYHSADGGATWLPLTNDLPPAPITALYLDAESHTLYAGLRAGACCGGLWQSTDHGATWSHVALGRDDLTILRVTRGVGTLFLAAVSVSAMPSSYVYRSSDNGRTWTAHELFHESQAPGSVLADLIPHPVNARWLFATTRGSPIYRSTDAGETWAPVQTALAGEPVALAAPTRLVFSPEDPDKLLLIRSLPSNQSEGPVLERSTDGGTSWRRQLTSGLPAQAAAQTLAALRDGIFLLSSNAGVFRSTDNAATWQPLEGALSGGGVAEFLPVTKLAQAGTSDANNTVAGQLILAATGYGVFSSRDGGALWQIHGSGLPFNSRIAGLLTTANREGQIWAISDNRPLDDATAPPLVLRSLDAGRTWTPAARGLPDVVALAWALEPGAPDSLLIATQTYFMRTGDGGLTWRSTPIMPGNHAALAVAPSNPRVIYLGGQPALRSSNRGENWQKMPVILPNQVSQTEEVTALAIDPTNPDHIWVGLDGGGVAESQDGGQTWRASGLEGRSVRWLASQTTGILQLYAGVAEDGVYRLDHATDQWITAAEGLPGHSTILALLLDPRQPGLLWATRDGGGVYRSTDSGASWSNVATRLGDNLAQAAALDFSMVKGDNKASAGALLIGTATAGVWALRTPTSSPPAPAASPLDARIEVLWPHDEAPVAQAKSANLGLRLFAHNSLLPPPCSLTPRVTIWQALDTNPAELLGEASPRQVDGALFPFWELNDVDVSRTRELDHKLYFMVQVAGSPNTTNIWAHAADPRTHFPQQDVPSGIATGPFEAVDARIQIVWPHDAAGTAQPPLEAPLANVVVMVFKHGTRLSVPIGWQPTSLTLYGAWNHEVGRPLTQEAIPQVRTSGAITYPIWEFTNLPVARAMAPGNRLYLWVMSDGIETWPNIWAHGADARTLFPTPDEPIQGCVP